MRNPDRLAKFYNEIEEMHVKKCPDWRVGQLWSNFFRWLFTKGIDPFFSEENDLLNYFKEFMGEKDF